MQPTRLAVAACVLLVLVSCGIGHSSEMGSSSASMSPSAAAEHSTYPTTSDSARTPIGEGVVLTISQPTSFTPTDTAYPRASRAAGFELTIHNGSDLDYRPASLAFTATIDGVPTEQVIDSTQGYTGTSGATEEIAPDDSLLIAVAFAVPNQPCRLRVAARQKASETTSVLLFDGTV